MQQHDLHSFLRSLLRMIRSDIPTMSCDECQDHADRLAELSAADLEIPGIAAGVSAHLRLCGDCREEFETLANVIRHQQGGVH